MNIQGEYEPKGCPKCGKPLAPEWNQDATSVLYQCRQCGHCEVCSCGFARAWDDDDGPVYLRLEDETFKSCPIHSHLGLFDRMTRSRTP